MNPASSVGQVHIRIEGITVSYNGAAVLDNFTLTIPPGALVAVIGPNGCGKTTLLRTLLGQLTPRTGAVLLSGDELPETEVRSLAGRDRARRLASVRQGEDSLFEFTVEEMVMMGRTPHLGRWNLAGPEDREIAHRAMRDTDVWDLRDRLITEISGGERSRAMIARALAQQPRVLLLDEPTSQLDLDYQHQILALLRRLNREQGLTIVIVIHQINLASLLAETVVLMDRQGRIRALGPPQEVITQAHIEEVYRAPVLVAPHPQTGRPQVIPCFEHNFTSSH